METFECVKPAWISEKLKEFKVNNSDLAAALCISNSHVAEWLVMNKDIPTSLKSLIFHYFSRLAINQVRYRNDVLKRSTQDQEILRVRIHKLDKRYTIYWNSIEPYLIVDPAEIIEVPYIDLSDYKYLLLDPEHEEFSILYEFKIDTDLSLIKKAQAELANTFEVIYG